MGSIYLGALCLALAPVALALDNGFGRTPVMGFNTYNDIACSPNQTYVEDSLRALSSTGLSALGYKFYQLDCGWQGYSRQSNGSITYDASVFPDGIEPLSQLARSLGLEWSMYTDMGVYSCDTQTNPLRPGSLGYEQQDALQFAGWNVAYMKLDNCYVQAQTDANHSASSDFVTRYGKMSDALQSVGIKGMDVCQWGVPFISSTGLEGPAQWTPPLATSFRVADDITAAWTSVIRIMNEAIPFNARNLTGPGQFADMDLLEVGNEGLSVDEQASHFALWALFKSPLMVSTSLTDITTTTTGILKNQDLIDINQDALGRPVTLVQRFSNDHDFFAGPLANGDKAVLLVDASDTTRTLSVDFSAIGISSADVKNLWTGQTVQNANSYSAQVNPHGSLPLRLSNVQTFPVVEPSLTFYEAESGQVAGGAVAESCSGCSGGAKVAFIGNGGSLTLSNIMTSEAVQNVRFDYLSCTINFAFVDQGENQQGASIVVNGGEPQAVLFPLTGYNWVEDVSRNFLVSLSGFDTSGPNTIVITALSGNTEYAPDLDRIGFVSA